MGDEPKADESRLTQYDLACLLVRLGGKAEQELRAAPSFGEAENYFMSHALACYREASEALARGEKADKPADGGEPKIVTPTNYKTD